MARSKVTDVPMALAVKIELFKRGCFDFITVKDGLKHEKQEHALKIPTMNTLNFCTEVLPGVQNHGRGRCGFCLCASVIPVQSGLSDVPS